MVMVSPNLRNVFHFLWKYTYKYTFLWREPFFEKIMDFGLSNPTCHTLSVLKYPFQETHRSRLWRGLHRTAPVISFHIGHIEDLQKLSCGSPVVVTHMWLGKRVLTKGLRVLWRCRILTNDSTKGNNLWLFIEINLRTFLSYEWLSLFTKVFSTYTKVRRALWNTPLHL